MRNRQAVWLVTLVLLLGLVLAACAPQPAAQPAQPEAPAGVAPGAEETTAEEPTAQEPAAEAPAPTGEKVKVDIFVGLGTGTDPDQIAAQEALAEKFNAEHENIEIEFVIVPNEESNERLVAMISGGEPPGLVGPGGVDVAASYFDLWEDVTPFIEAENFDTSDYYGAAVDLYQYPEKTVGLPLGMFPSFLFYNKDLFDAAGADYPTTDYADTSWNFDALRDLAMELTLDANGNNAKSPDFDPGDIVQYGFDDSWIDLRGFLTFFDPPGKGRPVSDDYKTSLVNSDEYKYGMEWLNNAIWADHFMADSAAQEGYYAVAGDPLGSELTAMFYSHTWFMPEGLVELPFEYDFAPAPFNQKGTRVARIHADTFYIPRDFEHKDASWEVLKWLTSEENIVDVCLVYGCLPARQSVQDEYTEKMMERYGDHNYDVIYNAIDYLDNPHHESWIPDVDRFNDVLGSEIFDRVYTEQIEDVDALMEEANASTQAILDDYWANQ